MKRKIVDELLTLKVQIRKEIKLEENVLAITFDAWLYRVFKSYTEITTHWFDKNWNLHSLVLDFRRFYTPRTGEAWATLLFEVLCDSGIEN